MYLDVLKKKVTRLENKKSTLTKRAMDSNDASEVRSINEQLTEINEELAAIQEEIDAIIAENDEERNQVPEGAELRGANIKASFPVSELREAGDKGFGSLEYRKAFMNYIQRGDDIPDDVVETAAEEDEVTLTSDIGAVIPTTIMNEFIKEVSSVYGQVYSKVRKLNVRGGVKFPITKLKATFKWIEENKVSNKQKVEAKDYVSFNYNVGEIRVAETLLAQVVSLPAFEAEITKLMVEAYLEAMDKGIIAGSGEGELLGIANDERVTNVVEMTAAEFGSWKAWRTKLFSKIPLSKRGQGEFLFPASSVESYLLTMEDDNHRPVFREATEIEMGDASGKFFGRETTLVEPDVIADFDTASAGDVVGIYWVPTDYAINTNFQFGVKRYFNEETNEWINKALTVVDGKILDPSGCYIIKKKNS